MAEPDPRMLDAVPAGVLSFRDDGRVTFANRPILDALGYDAGELIGAHVETVLGVAGKIFFQTHLFPLVRMHGRADEIYVELRARDGQRVPVLLNASRYEDEGGEVGDAVTHCVMIRVRERKKYEDELIRARKAAEAAHAEARAANEAKSRYLRSVSHEIRTPINALLGYADLLELGAGRPMGDKELSYVGRVRHAARHLQTLVEDILDLAKIESGAMTLDCAPADVAAASEAAFSLVGPMAIERRVHLVRDDAAVPGTYMGDHERVTQILVNLLTNAVKFTDAGGKVAVGWDRVAGEPDGGVANGGDRRPHGVDAAPPDPDAGPWLRVWVADSGIGIPAERIEEVFEPFHQVDEAVGDGTARPKGTGLGLAISRELARLMEGDITVRSEPGRGSTFFLWLRQPRSE